ncbi:MAG: GNAT family N-acetyltransferase [Thermoplasmatales archaeon]|nr:GNAT family N-acetyltransferase [Thermoplasmatales archaeon]MCK5635824.1 GNAT family N-acetyltransferase [Thermoplasmatales archaeon]
MDKEEIEIKIVDKWPDDEIVNLYKAGGWWKDNYAPSGLKHLIEGSYVFAVAIDKKSKKAIGMGRLLSDGVSDAYIQDLVVLHEYRDKGIGREIVKILLNLCKKKGINWVGLIAEPDQDGFYSTLGFKQMKKYVPMRYEKGE